MNKGKKIIIALVIAVIIIVVGIILYFVNYENKFNKNTEIKGAIAIENSTLTSKQKEQEEKIAQEKAEQEKAEQEKAEQEKIAQEKAQQEKLEAQKQEEAKIAAQKKEQEEHAKIAKQKEQESIKQEKQEEEQESQAGMISSILPIVNQKNNLDVKHTMMTVTNSSAVYSKASTSSAKVGFVQASERVMFVSSDNGFTKVKYCNGDSIATGFIPSGSLKKGPIIPNDFNNLVVPSNVTKVKYGTSGEGRGLYYYKIGSGSKILLLNFAIHGYEDSWMQDGFTLTQIGESVIKSLSEKQSGSGLNGWSVYVIPSSNPDGLIDGYTNNGPGRTQVSQSIDMNRDFKGPGFKPTSNPRNRTKSTPETAPEVKALANLVTQLKEKSSNLIVIDTHGWLNFTAGNSGVAKYFDSSYGLSNMQPKVYDGGYLVGYARSIGARETLVELPNPGNPAGAASRGYNQKMINAVNNIIKNYKF
ncbi:MAG: M14 family zinc carboxypeptidase [Sarcina sp.]